MDECWDRGVFGIEWGGDASWWKWWSGNDSDDISDERVCYFRQGWLQGEGGGGVNTPPPLMLLTELDHHKWPTVISCLIKEFELVKPQHWPARVGQTSTLTNSSRSNLNSDHLESVKPQYWPSRVGQTSTLTISSWPNLNIDRLELAKPQHWPTRVGQTSTLTDSSWSNLNIDRLESVKPQHWQTRVG